MKDRPNLASRLEVVSVYKCLRKFSGPSPKFGAQKNIKFCTFFVTSDTTYLWNETLHGQTKMLVLSTMCPLKVDLLSVTFDPETAEIHLLIVTHPSAAIMLQPSKL